MNESNKTTGKRRSRFEDNGDESVPNESGPNKRLAVSQNIPTYTPNNNIGVDITAAAAKAAEISRELSSKIAMASSILGQFNNTSKVASKHTLRLDAYGREIDEQGNVIQKKDEVSQIKTISANISQMNALKKKENVYLAHRTANDDSANDFLVDDRLPTKKREMKGKKSLHFVEPGKYVQEANIIKEKEERKIIAGYASGRKNIQHLHEQEIPTESKDEDNNSVASTVTSSSKISLPLWPETTIPTMEWWDEAFLPKQKRDQRKISKAAQDKDDFEYLSIVNCKTYKYVQHPVAVKPLTVERAVQALPMYLTKKERKKLRKATRQEREREKRDKMMLGLIAAPEPKFKLSNFMKVLGDQAVADPSRVELRVIQQMQQRILNHEMRNQAAKLTPKERKDKKTRKLMEDVSKGVHVAVFRVTDFSSLKHRFKVDVNAQQLFLSGLVLLCQEEPKDKNLVVAEGGPKAIRKFIRLMTQRIRWEESDDPSHRSSVDLTQVSSAEGGWNYQAPAGEEGTAEVTGAEGDGNNSDEDDESVESQAAQEVTEKAASTTVKRCDLLWEGILPRKTFAGFKYQESKTSLAAKKLLESKNTAHYWDMVEAADSLVGVTSNQESSFF